MLSLIYSLLTKLVLTIFFSYFQSHLERTESEILELSHNAVNLKSNYLELTELKYVLEKAHAFFQEVCIDSHPPPVFVAH